MSTASFTDSRDITSAAKNLKVPTMTSPEHQLEGRGRGKPRQSSIKALDRIRQIVGEEVTPKLSKPSTNKRRNYSPVEEVKSEDIDKDAPSSKNHRTRKRPKDNRRRVQCDICLRTFDMYHLEAHKSNKHSKKKPSYPLLTAVKKGQDNNPYECPLKGCRARLKTVGFLKSHFILHLENNPYACPVPGCGVKCDAQCHLDRHLRQHTGKMEVKCPTCGLQLCRKDKLATHKCDEYQAASEPRQKSYKNKYAHPRLERIPDMKKSETPGVSSDSDPLENVKSTPKKGAKARVDINSIFLSDPVFIKVCKEVPGFKELIIGAGAGRPPGRGRKPNSKIKSVLGKVGSHSVGPGYAAPSTTRHVKVESDLIIQDDYEDEDGFNDNGATEEIAKSDPDNISQDEKCANHNAINGAVVKLEPEGENLAPHPDKTEEEMDANDCLKIEPHNNDSIEIKYEM